ncbi:flagellar motor protein MotB [Paenibacillus validus]|uniref:flagellar motor protein MotB n=1 Tax=Paenibacillus TaxID=44249 RepID=UPI0006CF28C8|nr:flagellar motor protein MotB [Paenibacillus validus]MED4604257.1 flagellar motor protein MotB [Paenibacillus validus]MED4609409.1 flagellar motor protein MotB [Paenibacillus validus]
MSKKKHREHHEEHIDETWLIPYADLLTLLLALFIILFASSQVDSKKYDSIMRSLNSAFAGGTGTFDVSNMIPLQVAPNVDKSKYEDPSNPATAQQQQQEQQAKQFQKEQHDLEQLKERLDQYIADNQLSAELDTQLTDDLLMITIRDNALFSSGSATVKPEATRLAGFISEMLAQYPNYRVEVAGHTDNVPIGSAAFETNWDLSSKRALNFMKILLENDQIGPARFRSIGYGEYHPIDTNDTEEGRSKNRRVEVSILRSMKTPQFEEVPK